MSPSFRPSRAVRPLILPLALLGCLLAAGCTSMLSPLASSSGSATADQTRTEAWLQSLTGLTPMEQARRAEIAGGDHNSWRRNIRILFYGQGEQSDDADNDNRYGDDGG